MRFLLFKYKLCLCAFAFFLTSCSPSEPESIKVGLVSSQSGVYSEVGVSGRNGAEIAVEVINNSGGINGRPLELIIKDDKTNTEELDKVLQELKSRDVKFVIGPFVSILSGYIRDNSKKNGILHISPTISTPYMSDQDDLFIRIINETSGQGAVLAEYDLQKGENRRAAVIYDVSNYNYTYPIFRSFQKEYEAAGSEIVYSTSINPESDNDYIEIAKKIAESQADVALLLTTAIDAAVFAQHIKRFSQDIQLYGARWSKTEDIIRNGGRAVEGMVFSSMYEGNHNSEEYQKFSQIYMDKFGHKGSFIAAYSYEAVMLLAKALRQAGKHTPESVKDAIIEMGSFTGLQEDIFINRYGDAIRKNSLIIIRNNRFEVLNAEVF